MMKLNSISCGSQIVSGLSRQRGVAMVEFTIVVSVLLLLMLAVTEIGNALVRYNALTKAVEAGARHAANYALGGSTGVVNLDAQLIAEAQNVVVFGNPAGTGTPLLDGLTPGDVSVTTASPTEVRVNAIFPYTPLFGSGIPSFGAGSDNAPMNFNMAAAVTMRAL